MWSRCSRVHTWTDPNDLGPADFKATSGLAMASCHVLLARVDERDDVIHA